MIAVVSRVTSASVTTREQGIVAQLPGPGLLALVGVGVDDGEADVEYLARKLAELRLSRSGSSLSETGDHLLLVSQFTLLASTTKGRRPSFTAAAPGPLAARLLDRLAASLAGRGVTVHTGVFGADMAVASVNDGPYTFVLESPRQPR